LQRQWSVESWTKDSSHAKSRFGEATRAPNQAQNG
jgi:hypothetical protein